MPSLGPAEILVILVIALLVFGPNKLPDVAKQAGKAFQELRRVQQHLRSEISGAMSDLDGSASSSSASTPGGDSVPMLPPQAPESPADTVTPSTSTPDTSSASAPDTSSAPSPPSSAAPPAPDAAAPDASASSSPPPADPA